jgi:hypothetical protein
MIRLTKWAIWLYLILLIFEGALRKWIFPGQQEALLIIRDPVLLFIYACALGAGIIPRNGFIMALVGLIGCSFVFSFLAGQTNLLVTLYGLRTNYLHVPLIWVMAEVLDRKDVEKLGTFLVLMILPMTLIMIQQFRSPMDAYINRGVGGDDVGQIYGALGRIRPPGFFSFITGPMVYFPIAAAFFLHQAVVARRIWWPVLMACGVALIIAQPVSISRGTMIATAVVGAVYGVSLIAVGGISPRMIRLIARSGITGFFLLIGLSFLPIFKEARMVFMDRWDTAAQESQGNAWGSLYARVMAGFTQPIEDAMNAPFFGHGIGVGSNVGARLLSGSVGFLLAEGEWDKSFLELGPLLGGAFILFRVSLVIYLLVLSLRALLRNHDPLPLAIWAGCFPGILWNQWAPPTLLGFAVVGGGLVLASLNYVEEDEDEEDDEEVDEDEDSDEAPDASSDEDEEVIEPLSTRDRDLRRLRGL